MKITSCLLYFICYTITRVASLVYPAHRYFRNLTFDDKTCNDVVFSITDITLIACSTHCAQERTCKSFCYNRVTRTCHGCSVKYTDTQQMVSENGFQYYPDATRNYHMACEIDSDCNMENNICEMTNKICVCTPGYSFHSSSDSCLTECSEYGDTYEIYPYFYISGLNSRQIRNTIYQNCTDYCSNESTFVCRSFDWAMDNTTCSLAVVTPLTHPTRYVIGGGGSYNHRNCA